jgi:hypothetical protein
MRYQFQGQEVKAVQYRAADPRTHWHVNVGDAIAKAIGSPYVRVGERPSPISDGDWVVSGADALRVVPDAEFKIAQGVDP